MQRENILKDIVRKSYQVRANAITEAKKENDQFQPPPPPSAVAAPSPSAAGAGAAGAARASGATTAGSVLKVKVVQLESLFSDLTIGDLFYACPDNFPGLSKFEGETRTYGVKVLSQPTYSRYQNDEKAEEAKVADPSLVDPIKVKKEEEVPSKGVEVKPGKFPGADFEVVKVEELAKLELPAEKKEEVETIETEESLTCTQSQNQYKKIGVQSVELITQFNETVKGSDSFK